MIRSMWLLLFALATLLAPSQAVESQERPRYGGELVVLVPSEPPSYDGHQEGTFGVVHPLAPHYNTLLRIDPFDTTGTKVVPDLAESCAQAAPRRQVSRRQRRDLP
jgi:peptide/nickel transport system substrate-binding protein